MGVAGAFAGRWLADNGAAILVGVAVLQFGWNVHSPNVPKWLGLYGCAVVLGGHLLWRARIEGGLRLRPPAVAALALLLWLGASLAWSPDPMEGLIRLQNAFALFVAFAWFASNPGARVPWDALAIAGIGLSILRPAEFGGLGNTIFQSEYLLLLTPFCRWYVAGAVLVFLAVFDGATVSPDGASDAVWAAVGIYWLVLCWRARARLGWWSACSLLALPFFVALYIYWDQWPAAEATQRSVIERVELWTNTSAMWADGRWRLIGGVGLGGFMYWYPFYQESHLQFFPDMGTFVPALSFFVNAAHNDWLQILAVAGIAGLVLALWFVRELAVRAEGREIVFLLLAAALMGLNFPLQNPASAAVIAMACGLIARRRHVG